MSTPTSPPHPATNVGTLLVASDISKVYGSGHTAVTALEHASLTVGEGEFVALVGPSGSGKTTLLSIVGGLLAPTTGQVSIADQRVDLMDKKALTSFRAQRVGFVFQASNLVPFLTARENLVLMNDLAGRRLSRKAAKARADQLLGELGLSERADNIPEKLSGGERQRVAIGRALMNDPDILLVDEPTASLDTERGRQVVALLAKEIKDRSKTGIMVTHDLRMVEYTDRVYEILDGHVKEATN